MSVDWRRLAAQLGYSVAGEEVLYTFPNGRQQRVFVDQKHGHDAIRMWSVILGPAATAELHDGRPLEYAWERNRLSDLVGFSVDNRGRLIGESWIHDSALNQDLLDLQLSELARVCDWHELRLSGADVY